MSEQTTNHEPDAGFSTHWLTLREPADHAARSQTLTRQLSQWANTQERMNILDLGSGTGSNLRYLAPHLGHAQHWTLIDNDDALLGELPNSLERWATSVEATTSNDDGQLNICSEKFSASIISRKTDLASDLPDLPFSTADLVTGSALLDLTSAAWLDKLARLCLRHQCTVYFALSYNGLINWNPRFDEDETLTQLLNVHQMGDKGFGPALGPTAAIYLKNQMQSAGSTVLCDQSDWQLSVDQNALQTELISGWVRAVAEQDSDTQELALAWQTRRIEAAGQSGSLLRVGHTDMLIVQSEVS